MGDSGGEGWVFSLFEVNETKPRGVYFKKKISFSITAELHFSNCYWFRTCSKYYCLDAYHTQDSRTVDDPGDTSVERVTAQTLNEEACEAWFRILIESKWSQINMVDFYFKNGKMIEKKDFELTTMFWA